MGWFGFPRCTFAFHRALLFCTGTHTHTRTQNDSSHHRLSFFLSVTHTHTHTHTHYTHTQVSHRLGLCVIGKKEKKLLTVGRVIGLSQTIFSGLLTRLTLCPVPFPKKNTRQCTGSRAAKTDTVPAVFVSFH